MISINNISLSIVGLDHHPFHLIHSYSSECEIWDFRVFVSLGTFFASFCSFSLTFEVCFYKRKSITIGGNRDCRNVPPFSCSLFPPSVCINLKWKMQRVPAFLECEGAGGGGGKHIFLSVHLFLEAKFAASMTNVSLPSCPTVVFFTPLKVPEAYVHANGCIHLPLPPIASVAVFFFP